MKLPNQRQLKKIQVFSTRTIMLASLTLAGAMLAVNTPVEAASRSAFRTEAKSKAKAKATKKAKQTKSFPGANSSADNGRSSASGNSNGHGRSNESHAQSASNNNPGRSGGRVGASSGQSHTSASADNGHRSRPRQSSRGVASTSSRDSNRQSHVRRRGSNTVIYRNSTHQERGVVVYRPRPQRIYVASVYPSSREVLSAPTVQSNVQRNYFSDTVDVGFGLGASYNAVQLQSNIPMVNGKIRVLGQVNESLALGFDIDASSLLWVNHATIGVVASYDLLPNSNVALRPYASVGAGFLQVYQDSSNYLGPAIGSRVGIELKPFSAVGLSLEGGGVAALKQGETLVVPYVGATMSLYIL